MFKITNTLIEKMDFAVSGININEPKLSQNTTFVEKCFGCGNDCQGDCMYTCYLGCDSENRF